MARDRSEGKTALVLAGGGLTGAVYEIGALRAIDDLLLDRTVNDFDIYVGTSAGALISTFLANNISPEMMLRAISGADHVVKRLDRRHIFSLNYREIRDWGLKLPLMLINTWAKNLWNINKLTLFDVLWSFGNALPVGLYDSLALDRYVRETLRNNNKTNQFAELVKKLYIIATDLDNGDRVIFGTGYREDISISRAVAASSALPLLYKPVRIGEHEYVDGGLRGNASLDIAIEQGATLVVCINPMVPFDQNNLSSAAHRRKAMRNLSEGGIQSIASQMLRISTHAGLHYHVKQLRRSHPQVDIILIEPGAEDYRLMTYNIMQYSSRLSIARHGFESATLDLAEDFPYYKQVLSRHGIPITRRLVIDEIAKIQHSDYDPEVIRQILEARKGPCGQYKFDSPACQLTRVLSELEMTLETRYPAGGSSAS